MDGHPYLPAYVPTVPGWASVSRKAHRRKSCPRPRPRLGLALLLSNDLSRRARGIPRAVGVPVWGTGKQLSRSFLQ